MSFFRLLFANLFYHRRGNLAVMLGVAVGTAVLTGALLVGDSLRGSLRALTERQLGWVELALINKRFFREELADELKAGHLCPAVMLQVAARKKLDGNDNGPLARKVVLLGVDERFWSPSAHAGKIDELDTEFWNHAKDAVLDPEKSGVVLSAALAHDLGVKPGDRVAFSLQKISALPRETLMGRRDTKDVVSMLSLKVAAVLPDDHFGSRFTLNPGPSLPRNAFVPLRILQDELRHQDERSSQSMPDYPINVILAAGSQRPSLQSELKKHMTLEDWALRLRQPRRRFGNPAPGYLSLESREMFVPPVAQRAVEKAGLRAAPTLVYLVNKISAGDKKVDYALVAALNPTLDPPLGRFLPKELNKLDDDKILIVNWENSPFEDLTPGTPITLQYYDPDQEGELREKTATFALESHVPLTGPRNDMHLTPEFPGITDRRSMADLDGWNPPFPYDKKLVTDADEEFWRRHRTTPKAYITRNAGKRLWGSRFGDITSIRIDPKIDSERLSSTEARKAIANQKPGIERAILEQLEPEQGGLAFKEVRGTKLDASVGSNDFGMLFLGFSFFLIVAALLLIGLLFRLNIDRRASEVGLLFAVGYRTWKVRWLLLAEGALLSLAGGVVGSLIAIWYAGWLLDYLAARWPGGLDRSFLQLHIGWPSLVIGFVAAVAVSLLTIFFTSLLLGRVSPRALLGGATSENEATVSQRRPIWSLLVLAIGIVGAIICFLLGFMVTGHEAQAGSFMGSGFLLLTAGLALVWLLMKRRRPQPVTQGGMAGLANLGVRNAGRHPVRSVLTMGLLASASFLIIAVQAFHRNPGAHFLDKDGGSGGFALIGEADVPVFQNLNSDKARAEIAKANNGKKLSQKVKFIPFRLKEGDDASCLNLYKPREPRIIGVPDTIIERGGFQFTATEAVSDKDKKNPWRLLTAKRDDGTIPVFGENNTVVWALKRDLGGIVEITDGRGHKVKLRIVGKLHDSVFQSELLMSDENFRKLYPQREGFKFFLIETPIQNADQGKNSPARSASEVEKLIEIGLSQYGFEVTPGKDRLAVFLAVQNTYLGTFQALGGLGLLLGVLGLAVVLLRSVWERRGELALMRALGFRRFSLGWLVLAENSFLLSIGLAVGTAAALLSVAPYVLTSADVQWLPMIGLLLIVFVVGLLAGTAAVVMTLRAPLVPALRRE